MKNILILLLCLSLAACTGTAAQPGGPNYASAVITLERTPCFGTCSIYKLTIYGDGRVEYNGERFVAVSGQQTSTLTPEQVKELVDAFISADYFNLKDEYMAEVTDLPSTITSLTLDGQIKTITNYGGCYIEFEEKAPQALCDLETQIDTLTNSAQWVGQR